MKDTGSRSKNPRCAANTAGKVPESSLGRVKSAPVSGTGRLETAALIQLRARDLLHSTSFPPLNCHSGVLRDFCGYDCWS